MKFLSLVLATTLATSAYARTDLAGCVSSQTRNQWNEASMIWYVPETGEICDIPDCGGGRAPPKHDNPACPGQYTGTATYEPSYLPGYGPGAVASTSTLAATASASATTTAGDSTMTTGEASGVTAATSSVVVSSGASVTASDASSTSKPGQKTGSSSAAASGTSGSAGAQQTGNGADMLKWNAVGAVAAVALAAVAL
ncbi:putative cell surface protein [Aspergillus clavatus NRRL 1]|uniref:Cell surface protein, putative n=1 Tax=Aspergillus clavatus (strain ATCC 1007 / CBS 513.65 / DSM 816 / NCTC 3887 / NRRL 1 / QM 1276 / 107) TaxID=344612 RepID=A1CCB4_ASPCL|nr:cell surface protein, putative [Aspergillus clavatus NRRL 1]EAW12171.1 cell surface protein, putative [Aspergillus clavatus NRRL 1]